MNKIKYMLKMIIILSAVFSLPINQSCAEEEKAVLDEKIRSIKAPQEGEAFGLVQEKRLRFKFGASETYDDNIFLTKDDPTYDLITTLSPGIFAYYGNSNTLLFASYRADVLLYAKTRKGSRINQDVEGRIEFNRNSLIKLTLSDSFRPTSEPATSETNAFVKRIYNDFKTVLRYDVSDKSSLEINYDQTVQHYLTSTYERFSYLEQIISPILYWHISPKTSISGEYNFGTIRYYEGTDYDSTYHQARAGIEGVLTPKSSVYLKGGYQYKIYSASSRKNAQGAAVEGVYNYKWTEKTTMEFTVAENITESVYADVGYYKSLNLYASIRHSLSDNLGLDLNGFYLRGDYPKQTAGLNGDQVKRSDNIYGYQAKLDYKFRYWLSSYIGYEFRIRDSNIREFGYKENKIFCGGKVDF